MNTVSVLGWYETIQPNIASIYTVIQWLYTRCGNTVYDGIPTVHEIIPSRIYRSVLLYNTTSPTTKVVVFGSSPSYLSTQYIYCSVDQINVYIYAFVSYSYLPI